MSFSIAWAAPRHGPAIRDLAARVGLSLNANPELLGPEQVLLTAEDASQELVGFLSARLVADGAELLDLATQPDRRRRGVARALLARLLDLTRQAGHAAIHLEVRQSNLGAIALYEKLGFEVTRRRAGYYMKPREDALCMTLSIDPEVSKPPCET